jgi:uncharacterized Tic20 family protein
MKFYYYIENDEKKGPFTILEKDEVRLSPETLVWEESFETWKKASEVGELNDFFRRTPIPIDLPKQPDPVGYGSMEDIARVNYRNAIVFTGAYIALTLFYNSFFYSFLGFFVWFILPMVIWKYFKKYFESMHDHETGKFVKHIMLSYAIYFVSYLVFKIMVEGDMAEDSMIELVIISLQAVFDPSSNPNMEATTTFLIFSSISLLALFGSLVMVVISGIRVMKADRKYDFPLKKIAIATIICIPLSFLSNLGVDDEIGIFWRVIHLIPYFLLLRHFYDAETLDKTRD